MVKLPCGHASIEITDYQDKFLECPTCHHKWLMTNNKYGSKKLTSND